MRARLAAVLLACLAAPSAAADWSPSFETPRFHKVVQGFHPPGSGPAGVFGDGAALTRTIKLTTGGEHCTAVLISAEGHALTAGHCLAGMLAPGARPTYVRDVALYHGAYTDAGAYGLPVTLIAAGFDFDLPRVAVTDAPSMMRRRAQLSGDWAIVKLHRRQPFPCVEAGEDVPRDGALVWSLGYPNSTSGRRPGTDADAGAPRVTYGVVVADLSRADRVVPKRDGLLPVVQPALDALDMILSDADQHGGMSGAPIFDAGMRLVGAATATVGETTQAYKSATTLGVTVRKIFSDLRDAGVRPETYFRCADAPPPVNKT